MTKITQADHDAAEDHFDVWYPDTAWGYDALVDTLARHRIEAFADGFQSALQGAEAVIWQIEDDAFVYANVSEALREVITELQEMEAKWTGRVSMAHREQAAAEERAKIVAWLRESPHFINAHQIADCIEAGEHETFTRSSDT
ncbi:hypothetical protein UFOVP749_46 [uncultured Caudovirales phage]|uniref:Uncharacterized protein n=1 Tax=uncultured Caudovirales phage TaxID=2100421 RepID=A0A6J7X4Z3_9CAUD|nr:hypothetical protein UFOVP749_46 [uncultured Caudovirales phage]